MTSPNVAVSDYFRKLVSDVPAGIDRNISAIMLEHVGAENAITLREMEAQLRPFYPESEVKDLGRKIRLGIQRLRDRQFIIASSAGNDAGYFLPLNRLEFNYFIDREIDSRIQSLTIIKHKLVRAADKTYGPAYQEGLFNG